MKRKECDKKERTTWMGKGKHYMYIGKHILKYVCICMQGRQLYYQPVSSPDVSQPTQVHITIIFWSFLLIVLTGMVRPSNIPIALKSGLSGGSKAIYIPGKQLLKAFYKLSHCFFGEVAHCYICCPKVPT